MLQIGPRVWPVTLQILESSQEVVTQRSGARVADFLGKRQGPLDKCLDLIVGLVTVQVILAKSIVSVERFGGVEDRSVDTLPLQLVVDPLLPFPE